MTVEQTIRAKLEAAFAPGLLEIVNESHLHAGHAGSPGTGHSHFRVRILAQAFRGLSRVAAHRRVNEILAEELKGTIHALAISTGVPSYGRCIDLRLMYGVPSAFVISIARCREKFRRE